MIDFPKLISQFRDTDDLRFISLIMELDISPDQHLYKLNTNNGMFFVYEVDYISSFKEDVIDEIQKHAGNYEKLFTVKSPIPDQKETGPVKRASLYLPIDNWSVVSTYANTKYGSRPYCFSFLAKSM